jgi:hypothetical protein
VAGLEQLAVLPLLANNDAADELEWHLQASDAAVQVGERCRAIRPAEMISNSPRAESTIGGFLSLICACDYVDTNRPTVLPSLLRRAGSEDANAASTPRTHAMSLSRDRFSETGDASAPASARCRSSR